MKLKNFAASFMLFIILMAIGNKAEARHHKWCKHGTSCCNSHPRSPNHPTNIVEGTHDDYSYGRGRYHFPKRFYAKDKDNYGYYANRYYDGCRYYSHRYHKAVRYSDGCRRTSRRHFRSEWH